MRSERPLYWVPAFYENNPPKNEKFRQILHETESTIRGVPNVEFIGI